MTLIARAEKRFGKDVREMLAVIANQVAIALENGFLYRKMETMATTDGLTGLTNHRTFQQRFADMLERAGRHNHRVALLLCDVDHFKKVNDNYGHPIGDEVLRRVARVLQEVPRKIDIPARYGGEEFAVLLPLRSRDDAEAVAERLRQVVEAHPCDASVGHIRITVSIGVAFHRASHPLEEVLSRADVHLYEAKQAGRNCVICEPTQASPIPA